MSKLFFIIENANFAREQTLTTYLEILFAPRLIEKSER